MVFEVKHLPMIAGPSIDRGSSMLMYSVSDPRQVKTSTGLPTVSLCTIISPLSVTLFEDLSPNHRLIHYLAITESSRNDDSAI